MNPRKLLIVLLGTCVVAACATGPRRVSEPAASLQQVTVAADGSWSVDVRLQNYSSIPMRFDAVQLDLRVDGEPAGTLASTSALTIGSESADVVTLALDPTSQARLHVADALAGGRSLAYRIEGSLRAAPEDRGNARDYRVRRESALSPVPGLPGVLR
ncbi:LEA type 2 family protein [Luteimonas deserti]|uniref:LEA type 2 family protein n=1 Tax=Luteimonas deserti TaxID=2752306 RepID=A0A7Z0QRU9_9GAMM|nr:LEA type 2 family protein [Luteimonas deserti]NYZ62702.1 LEA type 2 family protein [Luteimonas deserti]